MEGKIGDDKSLGLDPARPRPLSPSEVVPVNSEAAGRGERLVLRVKAQPPLGKSIKRSRPQFLSSAGAALAYSQR